MDDKRAVFVSGPFDDLRSPGIRFLQEASGIGPLTVFLWSDKIVNNIEGKNPKFPQAERLYFIESLRWVDTVLVINDIKNPDTLPETGSTTEVVWAVPESDDTDAKRSYCRGKNIEYHVVRDIDCAGFPLELQRTGQREDPVAKKRNKVIVTGCYDWLHTGHIRFFEEVSELGDLNVVLGYDSNVHLLKGEGHPLFPQEERQYVVQSIKYVREAHISTGSGWLDAEPEIEKIRPHMYAVNEDGDKPEKHAFCKRMGIEYVVLKRTPKEGLPPRTSTNLRGF
jgi:cytidyltransferase-like protein